jgi:hypothetical protein
MVGTLARARALTRGPGYRPTARTLPASVEQAAVERYGEHVGVSRLLASLLIQEGKNVRHFAQERLAV